MSRYFLSSFSNPENGERARSLLIEKLKAAISSDAEEAVVPTSPLENNEAEEETWEEMAKRRKVERQQEVVNLMGNELIRNNEFSATSTNWPAQYH